MYYSGVVVSTRMLTHQCVDAFQRENIVSKISDIFSVRVLCFCCPQGTLLSSVRGVHIDPVLSISRWRQYCSDTSAPRLQDRCCGDCWRRIGDLWKNLKTLPGRWENQQHSAQRALKKSGNGKIISSIDIMGMSESETHGVRSHVLSPLGRGHWRGLLK